MKRYFGNAAKLINSIAPRLGGCVAPDGTYAVDVNGNRVLYRHANFDARGSGYDHWDWMSPFGRRGELSKIDYVLLHASKPEETFYLVPFRNRPTQGFPPKLGWSPKPIYPNKLSDQYEPYRMSLAEVRRKLGS